MRIDDKMKKTILASGIISLILNLCGMAVNYFHYRKTGHLLISLRTYGGEFMGETAFGLSVSHGSVMNAAANQNALGFTPAGFLIFFLVTAAAVFVLLLFADPLIKKIGHSAEAA